MSKASDNPYPSVLVVEGSAPATPASGDQRVYIDVADHKFKRKDSSGTVTTIEGGGSSGPAGKLGYAQITSSITTTSTTAVDATGLTVTVTIGSRPVKVTVWAQEFSNNTGTNRTVVNIFDTTAGVVVATGLLGPSSAGAGPPLSVMAANLSPSAGSRSYKMQYYAIDGGTSSISASATSPAFILVEEI